MELVIYSSTDEENKVKVVVNVEKEGTRNKHIIHPLRFSGQAAYALMKVEVDKSCTFCFLAGPRLGCRPRFLIHLRRTLLSNTVKPALVKWNNVTTM